LENLATLIHNLEGSHADSALAALGLWFSIDKPSMQAELPTAPQANKPTISAPLPSDFGQTSIRSTTRW
jgi:hypothetical protein